MLDRRVVVAAAMVIFLATGQDPGRRGAMRRSVPPDTVTFANDIAPILYRHCASCHHPGGSAPFGLLSYRDAASRGALIATLMERRAMPPWLPEPGYAEFAGERTVSAEEIATVRRWVDGGLPEGNPADLPDPPTWDAGWLLGEPDLVVELPTYSVPAGGGDLYRNLVVPIPTAETRYVSSVEVRPGHPGVVHHARMMIDTTSSSRLYDEQQPGPGFDGMDIVSNADNPPGHFVGWTPGKVPSRGADEIAWPLQPGTDLVLQLHLRPTGQPEVVEAKVGFHFAEQVPLRAPALVMLGSYDIDIPPGQADYVVTDTYELPVEVQVLGVYPHAHYLGKEVHGFATLPGGRREWLIRIDDWDFNWQDQYRYRSPIKLPKGTTLTMRWIYDNSAANPRNPNAPPKRVRYGSLSSDEMSDLVIQVLPDNRDDLVTLLRDLDWKYEIREITYLVRENHIRGNELAAAGKFTEAIGRYQAAIRLKADDPQVFLDMAEAFAALADYQSAILVAERAVAVAEAAGSDSLEGIGRRRLEVYRRRN